MNTRNTLVLMSPLAVSKQSEGEEDAKKGEEGQEGQEGPRD
jgi:hypothetical protein